MKLIKQLWKEARGDFIAGLLLLIVTITVNWLRTLYPGIGLGPFVFTILGVLWLGFVYLVFKHYQQTRPPAKTIILLADFDEPGQKNYRVTETILNHLRAALEPYQDVQIKTLGRLITEKEGGDTARAEGENYKATIVIWGWYGAMTEVAPLSVHFEVVHSPQYLPELGPGVKGQIQTRAIAELERFTLQPQLSAEMAYLALFTVGVVRYEINDADGAIECFSDALNQTTEQVPSLDRGIIYGYRGLVYAQKKGAYDLAIADLSEAIKLQPNDALFYNDRGNAHLNKGKLDLAIADYDEAIRLRPGLSGAYFNRRLQSDLAGMYYNRGFVRFLKINLDLAIADFSKAIKLQPNDVEFYTNRGLTYILKGDLDVALDDLNEATKIQPNDLMVLSFRSDLVKAYLNRGLAYIHKNDFGRAIADHKKVLELSDDPDLQKLAKRKLEMLEAK